MSLSPFPEWVNIKISLVSHVYHIVCNILINLRIRALEDGRSFLAVWTAPGDDYDHGSVSGYRFVYSSNISALLNAESGRRAETLLQFQRPDSAGVQTSYQFEFEHYNK